MILKWLTILFQFYQQSMIALDEAANQKLVCYYVMNNGVLKSNMPYLKNQMHDDVSPETFVHKSEVGQCQN